MTRTMLPLLTAVFLSPALALLVACGMEAGPRRVAAVPPEYVGKHMPAGWWADQSVTDEGRALYQGSNRGDVNCAKCHGRNGKPVKAGARDFRDRKGMARYSDSYLLWRLAEGVPLTRMAGYKNKLNEEQMWKIIAFLRTFGLDGMRYDVASKRWVLIGEDGSRHNSAQREGA